MLPKKKWKFQTSSSPFDLQWCSACKICEYSADTALVGVTTRYEKRVKAFHGMDPILDAAWVTKTPRLYFLGLWVKPNTMF